MVVLRRALLAAAAAGVAACQDAGGRAASPGLPGAGASGTPIAVAIIEGALQKVRAALASELSSAAAARRVEVVGPGAAVRYRVRGYLTAETTAEDGPTLAFRPRKPADEAALRVEPDFAQDLDRSLVGPRQDRTRPPRRTEHERDRGVPERERGGPGGVKDGAGQPG